MFKTIRPWTWLISLVVIVSLGGCIVAPPLYTTDRYPYEPAFDAPHGADAPGFVEYGRIASIDVIRTQTPGYAPSGGGAVAGGLVGGLVGNQFGRGDGRALATVLGLLGGALLGNTIEAQQNAPRRYQHFRILIDTEGQGLRDVDVPYPGDLRVGDWVRLQGGRIVRM